jgi:hypothetical protein
MLWLCPSKHRCSNAHHQEAILVVDARKVCFRKALNSICGGGIPQVCSSNGPQHQMKLARRGMEKNLIGIIEAPHLPGHPWRDYRHHCCGCRPCQSGCPGFSARQDNTSASGTLLTGHLDHDLACNQNCIQWVKDCSKLGFKKGA